MSNIGGIGGTTSAWSGVGGARRKERMFSKVDVDGSGGVDKKELQGMLDHIARQTGGTVPSADDLFAKFDTDKDGSIGSDELDSGAQSLLSKPSSTLEFAQRAGGPPPGPPSGGGPPPGGAGPTKASSTATDSLSTDPLDTNGDGVVSASEQAAGDLKALLTQLFTAADTDGDKTLSSDEKSTLSDKIDAALAEARPFSSKADPATAFANFTQLVLKHYQQVDGASAVATAGSGLNVAA